MKNASKEAMILEDCCYLQDQIKKRQVADSSNVIFAATRKEPQCPHRLMNILFSERFAEGFAQLGSVADWVLEKSAKSTILGRSARSIEGQDEAYNNMHFVDDEVLSDLDYINFGVIVPQSWKN